jgi:hypothetical protein
MEKVFILFYSVFSLHFFFFFLSALLSLSAMLSLPQSQVNGSMEVVVGWWLFGMGFVFVFLGGFVAMRLFPDLLVMVVRGGDGVCVWVVAMRFGGWFLSPFLAVVADKMGCGEFGSTGVGMVVVGLGLLVWVWGLWVVAVVKEA